MERLLAGPLSDLNADVLRRVLADVGDEDTRWETKGGVAHASAVVKAVAGLANRDGGVLVLGAERGDDGLWRLVGVAPVRDEPALWLDKVLNDGLRPAPSFEVIVCSLDDGRWAGVVRVKRASEHLAVTSDGRVYRREHGQTRPVSDGTRLTQLVLERAHPADAPAAAPRVGQDPDELAQAVRASIERGVPSAIATLLPQLRRTAVRAAEAGATPDLDAALDRLAAVTATVLELQMQPPTPVAFAGLRAWHELFDAGLGIATGPRRPELDLWRAARVRVRASVRSRSGLTCGRPCAVSPNIRCPAPSRSGTRAG